MLGRLGDSMVLSDEVGREQNMALLQAGLSHTLAAKTQGNMYAEALGGSGGAEATGGDGGGDFAEDEEMTLARIDLAFAAMHREALVEVAIAKTRTRAGHDEEAVAEVDPQGAVARKKAVAGPPREGRGARRPAAEDSLHHAALARGADPPPDVPARIAEKNKSVADPSNGRAGWMHKKKRSPHPPSY